MKHQSVTDRQPSMVIASSLRRFQYLLNCTHVLGTKYVALDFDQFLQEGVKGLYSKHHDSVYYGVLLIIVYENGALCYKA